MEREAGIPRNVRCGRRINGRWDFPLRRLSCSHRRGDRSLDSEKAEVLAESLEAQFQPANDPTEAAVIEKVEEELTVYTFSPDSETKLTIPAEIQNVIRGLKFCKAPGPSRTG